MKKSSQLALRAVLLYCFLAGLWILLSDRVLAFFIADPVWLTRLQTCKGLAFVAITAVFFYVMLRDQLQRWEKEVAGREKLEGEVALREQLLSAFFTNAPAGLVLLDKDLRYVRINDTVAEINGVSVKDHLGRTVSEVLPKLGPVAEPLLRQVLATGQPMLNIELSGETPGQPGVRRHWMESFFPIFGNDGKPDGVGAIFVEISERKRAENELRESNDKFLQLVENITDVFWIRSPDFREVQYVSPAFERVWGRSVASLYAHPEQWADFIFPEDRERVLAAFGKLAGGMPSLDLEYRIVRPDGEIRWVHVRGYQVRNAAGQLIRHTGIVTDITERKRADEKLRQSEADLAEGQRVAKLGSWRLDIASSKVRWSDELYRIFDVQPAMFHGTFEEFLNYVLPEDRSCVLQTNAHARANGSSFEAKYRIQMRAGDLKTIREIGHAIKDASGEVVSLFGTAQDITERERAESELRWKTAFLEAQVDSALDGILVVDHQGKGIFRNQRLNELWKLPPDVLETKDDAEQVRFAASRTKNPGQFVKKVNHLYAHPDEVSRDEIELLDGTILDRYSAPVRDKAGKYYGRIWNFRDITDQRKLEVQFRQAQKMEAIGRLAGGVAHDFNNILAVIQLQVGLLKSESGFTALELDYAGEIGKAAGRAANLTRQLLLFSRQQALQPHDLNLNEVVTDIAKMLKRILGEQIEMELKLERQSLLIHADAGMMDQVLMNLTVNARDAMPKGGRLVVETSLAEFDETAAAQNPPARPGSFACASVIDTGTGIPPEILPRIFDPFFTTKEVGKGTGLGLATVFGIVQQHRGWISVESEVGKGTTFRVYLPRLSGPSTPKAIESSPASSRSGRETILLVEDDVSLRNTVRMALSQLGYRMLEAVSGPDALKAWKQHSGEIHLLLTDMVLPGGMTGKGLAEELLQLDPQLKVIYTSGYSPETTGENFHLEEGVNFLAKPFETHKLAQTVRDVLDGSKPAT